MLSEVIFSLPLSPFHVVEYVDGLARREHNYLPLKDLCHVAVLLRRCLRQQRNGQHEKKHGGLDPIRRGEPLPRTSNEILGLDMATPPHETYSTGQP